MRVPLLQRSSIFALAVLGACGAPTPVSTPAPVVQAVAAAPAREAPPAPMPLHPLEFPGFRETTLPNGLRLIVVEHRGQPVANVNLYINGGSSADPAAKLGLADMAAGLLTKGTPTRSARQIAEAIEGVGGTLIVAAQRDFVAIAANLLADDLALAFALVGDVALNPSFPAAELETARTRTLSGLQVELSQPVSIAQRRFARELYGDQHPYGRAPLPQTVRAIQRADLVQFHRANFRADNALLVVSGDVNADSVEALAHRTFGAWRGSGAPQVTFPVPPARARAQITLVDRPGSAQSNILIGDIAVRPDNPDFPALQVLNKIVGGGTDARLFLILREQKGWTYGAYSAISRPKDVGSFVANAEVRTAVTDSALSEMLAQLRRVRDEPVSRQELEAAKSFLIGSFPLRIETAGQIAGQVAQTRLLGLPIEDLTQYREQISAVTIADVRSVARKYLRLDQVAIVVVGDAAKVLPTIEHIAPLALYDVAGRALERSQVGVRAAAERYDASRLQPQTLSYEIMQQGSAVGTTTSALSRQGNVWVSKTTLNLGAMRQLGELRFGSDFTGISATQSSARGAIELILANGRVTGSAQLPPAEGGNKTYDVEVPAGTLLPGMDEYALAMADLAVGKSLLLPLFNAMAGSVTPLALNVTGTEEVTVGAGTFPVFRVETAGGQSPMVIYVRQQLPRIIVKQEFAGQPVSIELKSVQ